MTARDFTAKAIAIVNAGRAIKANIKAANEDLARAYDAKKQVIMNACLAKFNEMRNGVYDEAIEAAINETVAHKLYWAMPDFHNFKEKHAALIREVFGDAHDEVIVAIEELVALRAAVKAAEVIVKAPKEAGAEEIVKARVMKNFHEFCAERRAQFNWAKEIIAEMNKELPGIEKLPVSVNHVYCMNQHGTAWLRIDWYFRGQKTAFNVIAAAADAAAREKEGK